MTTIGVSPSIALELIRRLDVNRTLELVGRLTHEDVIVANQLCERFDAWKSFTRRSDHVRRVIRRDTASPRRRRA